MSLLSIIVVLIVVGVLLCLINTYIPMDGKIKGILNAVVVIVVVLWLLQAFGLLNGLAGIRVGKNVIQLGAGTYALTGGELVITADVSISGKDTNQPDVVNPLTGRKPNRIRPDLPATGTFITATASSRIINASAALTLTDLVLTGNGTVTGVDGGVIYTGGNLALDNVVIDAGSVAKTPGGAFGDGGAIFLSMDGVDLALSDVTIKNSHAEGKGGAIAMVCQQDLSMYALHTISILRSLLVGNSANGGAGAIEICGNSNVTLTSSTLSANSSPTASPVSAAIAYVQGADVSVGTLTLTIA